jgi:hypothetical protein
MTIGGRVRLSMTRGGQPYGHSAKLLREDGTRRVLSPHAGKPARLVIEPGRYRVEVRGARGKVHTHSFTVVAGGDSDEVVELPPE